MRLPTIARFGSLLILSLLAVMIVQAHAAPIASQNTTVTTSLQQRSLVMYMNSGTHPIGEVCIDRPDPNMCTLAMIISPNWGTAASVYIYDHTCRELGHEIQVDRWALDQFHGYGFRVELTWMVALQVDIEWPYGKWTTGLDPNFGVLLAYKDKWKAPLVDNQWGLANFWAVHGDGVRWDVLRAQFRCYN